MIPSPTDLTYFIAVADLENLSRASERLGISQPSLTLAMKRLENVMGTPLLTRHKRGVSLTRAGKQLHTHARYLIEQWNHVKAKTLASMHAVQGDFTLGCHPSVALYSLSRFLPALLNTHPNLNIRLQHDLSRNITEAIIQLKIDVGIVVNPIKHPDVIIRKLASDKITLFQAKERGKPAKPSKNTVLIYDPNLLQTQAILKTLKKQGIEFSRHLTSSSLEVIANLTQKGLGIGILPTRIAELHSLQPLPKAPHFEDEICLLYHGQHREVKAMQVIVESIKEGFAR